MKNNQSEDKKRAGFSILSNLGRRISQVLLVTFFSGLGLCISDSYFLKQQCSVEASKQKAEGNELTINKQKNEGDKQYPPILCFLSPIAFNLGLSLITSVITIGVLELALRDEAIQQIQNIFNSGEATRYIKAFYPKQEDYRSLIVKNIRDSQHDQCIKLLCCSEELGLLAGDDTIKLLKEKLNSGCKFEILILHPQSSVLSHMKTVGLGSLEETLSGQVNSVLKRVSDNFKEGNLKMKGSIEVRLKKDLFSPIGYYHSPLGMNLVWMCLSTSEGNNRSPGFNILDQELAEDAKLHFENLWNKSKNEILLKIQSGNYSSPMKDIFQQKK